MTLDEARKRIREYYNSQEADTSHLSAGEIAAPYVHACEVLEDEGDEFDRACVRHLVAEAPSIFDWDAKGNWVGPVANENGWTA
jgi:hypothetical protein